MSSRTSDSLFSTREIRYLESLPAVERATPSRIWYTDSFKRDCVRRYNHGESPAEMFRRAGLDSSLIGYKRIERNLDRWKRLYGDDVSDATEDFEIDASSRWVSSKSGHDIDPDYDEQLEVLRLIVSQQARRIDQLERELAQLRETVRPRTAETAS